MISIKLHPKQQAQTMTKKSRKKPRKIYLTKVKNLSDQYGTDKYENIHDYFLISKDAVAKARVVRATSAVVFVSSIVALFTLSLWFFALIALSGVGFLGSTFVFKEEIRDRSHLPKRLEKFAKENLESSPSKKNTFINAVMDCEHGTLEAEKNYNKMRNSHDGFRGYYFYNEKRPIFSAFDDKGNCESCKEGFTLLITPELNDYLETELKKAVAKVKAEEKQRVEEERQARIEREKQEKIKQIEKQAREDKLSSGQTKSLVEAYVDSAELKEVKDSRYFFEELEKLR